MPAPVAARALTGYRVVDTVMGALSKIAPRKMMAAGEGGNTVIAFGGYDKETREPFVLVDMINGAWGGRWNQDGIEGVTNPSQNMSNLPIETLEARYPLRMEEYSLRQDSCGPGEFRGGMGLVRQYRLLAEEALLQIRSDRRDHAPYGLFGGGEAAPSMNYSNPEAGGEVMPSKITLNIGKDFVVRHEQAGGGGYGNPLKRSVALLQSDLDHGKVSNEYAIANHGVVFQSDERTIDVEKTRQRRAELGGL
ncbi:Hydantoinase B/oxoprolinase [compost metagenome]